MRYFFIKPTSWANDFVEYSLLYSTFLAAAWLAKTDSHIKLTALYDLLSDRSKLILDIISSTISCGVIACLFWVGATETFNAFLRGALIVRPVTLPKWIIIIALPIGFFLLSIALFRNILISIKNFQNLDTTTSKPPGEA